VAIVSSGRSTSAQGANWFPLTRLSHILDYQLFGLESGYHHLTSVLLHALSTLLLFGLLRGMAGARWRSAFVAGVFALHPLHIESVAWVAERKDVLSGLFWFATLWAYVKYTERPSRGRYLLVLAGFACGLMSKQMIVTLPLVALLLDFWPLKRMDASPTWARLRPLLFEKAPLLALSLGASVVTYVVQQRGGAVSSLDEIPVGMRIGNAVISYATYLAQLVWPANLSVFYPYPRTFSVWRMVASIALLSAITVAVWKVRRRRFLVVGWLWYLITLVPVIGLVQVGLQSHADRYTYIPLIGISIAVAWGVNEVLERGASHRMLLAALGVMVCVGCATVTWLDLSYWTDSVSLFRHAIAVTPDNYIAYNNLGAALNDGQPAEAIANFQAALRLKPAFANAESNFGEALLTEGNPGEAVPHLERALKLQPDLVEAHTNLGSALIKLGQADAAVAQYREALRLQPDSPEAHGGLGVVLNEKGQSQDALAELREAVRLKPEYADAHYNLGRVLGLLGRTDEAIAEFRETIRLKPKDAAAHFNLGTALASKGAVRRSDHGVCGGGRVGSEVCERAFQFGERPGKCRTPG